MLINSFKSLSPSTEVKILAAPECEINGEKIDIIKTFEEANIKNLHIEKTKSPFMNLFIKDGEELFEKLKEKDFGFVDESFASVKDEFIACL